MRRRLPPPARPIVSSPSSLSTRRFLTAAALLATLAPGPVLAQQILVDHGTRAAGLWCFPLAAQPKTYVYLPASARLATDDARSRLR